ncbi:LuxR family transcriptional regulator, maltose regulon positive regulatory protein [Marinobacter sp. LV10R510-11A]|uniref:LuxR C-terminal-related transcriptional regulator n=1 Tax=Marinobacter sp. LV10R510-11A TaxID=1415568 RepID=UPI000BB7E28B|nr:LuxR C-terminal-related transcriptional regulator [Marinobacter sp. LV10R510-11A]SOB75199.1 LuxR family transcriptional regulator, maltose regulon positive regulatory protein [Marinobacter sp. LV10R510-11A]
MLLTTKFLRPASDPRAVRRERLSSLLAPGHPKRMNLVIAPAGFGKTTLVSQWCARTTGPIAWLSLDEHDDEPQRFWQYIAGAFEHAGLTGLEDCHRSLAGNTDDHLNSAITALINALASDGGPWVLVLDDFQFVANEKIQRQFGYFVDYLPADVTVTLASRTEPPLPLARWRVRRWVQEIHPALLAFSEDECREFFHSTMGLAISEQEVQAICRRTEGWVAAMQLSALSGINSGLARDPSATASDVPLNALSIDERHISDYVLSEVLDKQPEAIVAFLLDTACCPRLCASMCNTIRNADDSQEKLQTLLSQNLFLIPLDNHNEWFRYHDLFRDALLQRIRHADPERAHLLWHRTVEWLLDHGQVQEAIAQIVQKEDWPWLAEVLATHGNNLIHGGYHLPVLNWLESLPPEQIEESAQLQMLRVWSRFFANRFDHLEPLLANVEDLLDRRVADSAPDAEGALGLQSEVSLIRSYLARSRSDDKSASDLTRQVLADIDHTRIPLKSVTYYGLGLDDYGRGDLTGAEEALKSAVHYGQVERKPSTVLSSGGLLAWIQYNRGDMDLALDTCTEVRRWVDQHYSDPSQPRLISCWLNAALTEIHRERNQLQDAAAHLAPLLEHVDQGTEPGQHVIIQHVRGHLAFSDGHFQKAIDALEDAEQLGRKRREHIVFEPPASAAFKARCFLATGQIAQARQSLESLDSQAVTNPLNREQNSISYARLLVAEGQPEKALEILKTLESETEQNEHNRHLVETLLVCAEALALQGRSDECRERLERAVSVAAEAGFMRLFVEESPRLQALLLESPALKGEGTWQRSLRLMLQSQKNPNTASQKEKKPTPVSQDQNQGLAEPLSQRELEVLELINAGGANKDIAVRMGVAPATVKAHIRNLYGKLGVGRRTEALARARELGLLTQ